MACLWPSLPSHDKNDDMAIAELIVQGVGTYLTIGLIFAVFFAFAGVGRVDSHAKGATLGFRVLIIPGVAALWPMMVVKWLMGKKAS